MTPENIKILIVDDEEYQLTLFEAIISSFGYRVYLAQSADEALDKIPEIEPNLILLDKKMPGTDGIELCSLIKNMPRYVNLPVIMLTSSDALNDKLESFDEGVDDYIIKDMDHQEINIRIQAVLRRYKQNLDSNPLTHLPGNNIIQKTIQKLIDSDKRFSVVYADLDNFKAYNDKYGFVKGDEMILFAAKLIESMINKYGNFEDFLGHVGGDDFIFITTPDNAVTICEAIKNGMDERIGELYNEEDRLRGYIVSKDRQGVVREFPLVTLSMAVISNEDRKLSSIAEISEIAGELKKLAKNISGNSYVFDKRKS